MFKNRSLHVKVVKDGPAAEEGEPLTAEAASKIVLDLAEVAFFGTAAIVAGYVAADTIRQVIIITAKAKIK